MEFGHGRGLPGLDRLGDSTRWQTIPPQQWSDADVLDWVFDRAERCDGVRWQYFKGENFQGLNGPALCGMGRQEFIAKDEDIGDQLYSDLQELIRKFPAETCSWQQKHPEAWNSEEILDWIFYFASVSAIDVRALTGERFQRLTGAQLCSMTCEEFVQRDPLHGEQLHGSLQNLLSQSIFTPPNDFASFDNTELLQLTPLSGIEADKLKEDLKDSSWSDSTLLQLDSFKSAPLTTIPYSVESMFASYGEKRHYDRQDSLDSYRSQLDVVSSSMSKRVKTETPESSSFSMDADEGGNRPPKQPSKMRLWKFMRDLLDNPQYNPEYIRWESKSEGIFRIVSGRSKAIADLWGKIKNNPTMTFDKLGRSLRWCRANNGLFSAIPKNGAFPKKLCFRFKTDQMD